MRLLALGVLFALSALCPAEPKPFADKETKWEGLARHDFQVGGVNVLVKAGWRLAPAAMKQWEKAHEVLVKDRELHPRPVLIGLSRWALYCVAWAAAHTEKALAVYLDNGVCDHKSWPGGKPKGLGTRAGSAAEWQNLLKAYGFKDDQEAFAAKVNPVDSLESPAKVPLSLYSSNSDKVVSHRESSEVVYVRYMALGGPAERVIKPVADHHPHGLKDLRPVLDFFAKAWADRK